MAKSQWSFGSATELSAALAAKKVSAVELAQHVIDRIERHDGKINAVCVRDFDRGLDAARAADAARDTNVVRDTSGVPAAKDIPDGKPVREQPGVQYRAGEHSRERRPAREHDSDRRDL